MALLDIGFEQRWSRTRPGQRHTAQAAMGDSSTQQFIRERPVSSPARCHAGRYSQRPAALSLGAHARRAEGSKLRGVPLEFLVPLTQFSCSGRGGHASSSAPEAIVEMECRDTGRVERMTAHQAAPACISTAQWRAPCGDEVAHGRFNFTDEILQKAKWPSGGPKAS